MHVYFLQWNSIVFIFNLLLKYISFLSCLAKDGAWLPLKVSSFLVTWRIKSFDWGWFWWIALMQSHNSSPLGSTKTFYYPLSLCFSRKRILKLFLVRCLICKWTCQLKVLYLYLEHKICNQTLLSIKFPGHLTNSLVFILTV